MAEPGEPAVVAEKFTTKTVARLGNVAARGDGDTDPEMLGLAKR